MDLLRFITAGNVDDGKSTLIGRLLYDSHSILEDQLIAMEEASQRRGFDTLNLALLTDGLRAEREQGITIDVAYRYFNTNRRKFIIADCPGHLQYTRNMVTGASTANLAIVMVDVTKGIVEQTRRHCFVASLLGIPHLVICVNKMDLVEYSEARFERVLEQFAEFSKKLEIRDTTFIPTSALTGANIVTRSEEMPWYRGRTVLEHLEAVPIVSDINLEDFRFPVQMVIRPERSQCGSHRGYAGRVMSGVIRKGDVVVALPSGIPTRITAINGLGRELTEASPLESIVLTLEDELDMGRGDMLVRAHHLPESREELDAIVCWMSSDRLERNRTYLVSHTTAESPAVIESVAYKFDINTLDRVYGVAGVDFNEFARIKLKTGKSLHVDPYRKNRGTGSFILVDRGTCATVAAGMIL